MEALQQKLAQLRIFHQDYLDVKALMESFPKSLISMIPYGNVAFREGVFENPNELFAPIGAEYFVKMSAAEAASMASRRADSKTITSNLQ